MIGISLRFIREYDIEQDQHPQALDVYTMPAEYRAAMVRALGARLRRESVPVSTDGVGLRLVDVGPWDTALATKHPDISVRLRAFEGDYHYPHGLLEHAAHEIEVLRTLNAADDIEALRELAGCAVIYERIKTHVEARIAHLDAYPPDQRGAGWQARLQEMQQLVRAMMGDA